MESRNGNRFLEVATLLSALATFILALATTWLAHTTRESVTQNEETLGLLRLAVVKLGSATAAAGKISVAATAAGQDLIAVRATPSGGEPVVPGLEGTFGLSNLTDSEWLNIVIRNQGTLPSLAAPKLVFSGQGGEVACGSSKIELLEAGQEKAFYINIARCFYNQKASREGEFEVRVEMTKGK